MADSNSHTQTLTSLLASAAAAHPTRPALSVPGLLSLSHSHLHRLVESSASRLISAGVRPGHTVALAFPNTPDFVIAFLAVIRARAVAAPLNSAYTLDEFLFYLSDSNSSLLLTGPAGNPAAVSAASTLNIRHATVTLSPQADSIQFSLPNSKLFDSDTTSFTNEAADEALFLHTSGTTSRPKGVPLTQRNLAASVTNIMSAYRLTATDSTVIVLPLFHVHGLLAGLLSSLAAGAAVTLPASGRFSASTFWEDMRGAGATWYTAVPTIHQILLDRHAAHPEVEYPKLRFIRSCSASLAPVILEKLEAAFGAPVLEAYAMTEAAHLMSTNPLPEDGPHKAGSVGKPAGQEMAVLGEDGEIRPPGVPGEVCIRGANVTAGYKNNPEANQTAFLYNWFHTGDIGVMDSDGYLHLVGRIKELINRGGEKISPIEVDSVLLSHPDIAQAVSFGVPDEKYGEEINCAVIPREGAEIGEEEVVRHCRKNLAAFKVPKKVFITDSLPKTATGKIQRRIVAENFLKPASVTVVGA